MYEYAFPASESNKAVIMEMRELMSDYADRVASHSKRQYEYDALNRQVRRFV